VLHGFAGAGKRCSLALHGAFEVAQVRSVRPDFDVSGYGPGYSASLVMATLGCGSGSQARRAAVASGCRDAGLTRDERYEATKAFHADKRASGSRDDRAYGALLAWLREWKDAHGDD
jgi:hypothetical protein